MTQHTWLARRYGSDAERPRLPVPLGRAEELFPTETARVHSPAPLQIAVFAVVTVFRRVLRHPQKLSHQQLVATKCGEIPQQPLARECRAVCGLFSVTRVNVSTISLGEMM